MEEAHQPIERRSIIVKPPTVVDLAITMPKLFLAGSIEQGRASEWQRKLEVALTDREVLIMNPRRDNWDPSLPQDPAHPVFRGQVLWELDGLERADRIAMFLEPETLAPISLVELGLFARSGKMVVCCPEGYWRKGNIDIVCERYGVPMVDSLDELINYLRKNIL